MASRLQHSNSMIRYSFTIFLFISLFYLAQPELAQATQCQKVQHFPTSYPLSKPQIELLKERDIDCQFCQLLSEGSEGLVLIDLKSGMVTKVFKSRFAFENFLFMHNNLSFLIEKAGFRLAKIELIDHQKGYVQRQYYPEKTLAQVSKEALLKDRGLFRMLLNKHSILSSKLLALIKSTNISFVDESKPAVRGYFSVVSGLVSDQTTGTPNIFYLSLHEENILVTRDHSGNYRFTIIDYW